MGREGFALRTEEGEAEKNFDRMDLKNLKGRQRSCADKARSQAPAEGGKIGNEGTTELIVDSVRSREPSPFGIAFGDSILPVPNGQEATLLRMTED